MNFFVLQAVVFELKELLLNAVITDCIQEQHKELIFKIKSQISNKMLRLAFDCNPLASGIFLYEAVERKRQKSDRSSLAYSFKKKVVGSKILDIQTVMLDRIVRFELSHPEWREKRELVFETNGKWGNVVCVNKEERITLECLSKVPSSRSIYVRIPGNPFIYWGELENKKIVYLDKKIPFNIMENLYSKKSNFKKYLLRYCRPMTPELACEIEKFISEHDEDGYNKLLVKIKNCLSETKCNAFLVESNQKTKIYTYFLPGNVKKVTSFDKTLKAVKLWRETTVSSKQILTLKNRLHNSILKPINRIQRSVCLINNELSLCDNFKFIQKKAQLLSAYYHLLRPGMEKIQLSDFENEEEKIEIVLDPSMTPREQIDNYYKEAHKLKRKVPILRQRLFDLETELSALLTLKNRIEKINQLHSLKKLESEMTEIGILSSAFKSQPGKTRMLTKSPFMEFTSSEKYRILVGRGARENDLLTFNYAGPLDIWLHVQGNKGAHVIIKSPNRKSPIPLNTILEAAKLAVYFSRAKGEKAVPVIYTQRRLVKKISRFGPGQVRVIKHKTVIVDSPDDAENFFKKD